MARNDPRYQYQGDKVTKRAYVDEPGWAPPPPRPEPLPERCLRPLTFEESGSGYGPTPYAPHRDQWDR